MQCNDTNNRHAGNAPRRRVVAKRIIAPQLTTRFNAGRRRSPQSVAEKRIRSGRESRNTKEAPAKPEGYEQNGTGQTENECKKSRLKLPATRTNAISGAGQLNDAALCPCHSHTYPMQIPPPKLDKFRNRTANCIGHNRRIVCLSLYRAMY